MGGCLLALLASFWLFPKLVALVYQNAALVNMLNNLTDASSRLGNLDLSNTSVLGLTPESIAAVLDSANLPEPLGGLLRHNLEALVFAPANVSTVGGYVTQTILSVAINVLCFLLCFFVCYIVISIIVNLLRSVFQFPVLRQMDWLAGGVFGALRGVALLYILFTALPLILTMMPVDALDKLVKQSTLAPIFQNGNLIIKVMNRQL